MKKSHIAMLADFFIVLPLTIYLGIRFLPGRGYYITSTLVIAELIVPFLLVFSLSVIWAVSRTAPAPRPDKLIDTTFSAADFRAETRSLAEVSWWRNYRVWGGVLLVLCMLILIIFR